MVAEPSSLSGPFSTRVPPDPRPWPRPASRPAGSMRWLDLLFAHWSLPPDVLRPHIPPGLELDTRDGRAWIGIVPFRMARVRPWWSPSMPWLSYFPELNVRTYVVRDGKPGVWFFSLDAGNPVAVRLARRFFHLPYYDADMVVERELAGVRYRSVRTHADASRAVFMGSYAPTGPAYRATPGDLDHWLTARYCLYANDARGNVYRGDIDHEPWPLQPARARLDVCDLTSSAFGFELPDEAPLLHFVAELDVEAWAVERV